MTLDISKFRFEFKYYVNKFENRNFIDYVKSNSKLFKIYPSRIVNSIYYDTHDLKFVSENLSGASFRKKLRLRWYNNNLNNANAEIKIKKNKMNAKVKVKIKSLSTINTIKYINDLNKNNYFKRMIYKYLPNETLHPKIRVTYHRDYYYFKGLIITFDKNISFTRINGEKNLKKINDYIMEIKFSSEKLDIYNQLKSDLPFRISRNSKYVTGMSLLGFCRYY
jgi:SPX domain protein involved in polyphosphate accumulation